MVIYKLKKLQTVRTRSSPSRSRGVFILNLSCVMSYEMSCVCIGGALTDFLDVEYVKLGVDVQTLTSCQGDLFLIEHKWPSFLPFSVSSSSLVQRYLLGASKILAFIYFNLW